MQSHPVEDLQFHEHCTRPVLSLELTVSSGDFVSIAVGACTQPGQAGDLAATAIGDLIETSNGERIAAHVVR